ncbi:MAG: hypothetical protein RR672_00240 [Raoultibacter sp.]
MRYHSFYSLSVKPADSRQYCRCLLACCAAPEGSSSVVPVFGSPCFGWLANSYILLPLVRQNHRRLTTRVPSSH